MYKFKEGDAFQFLEVSMVDNAYEKGLLNNTTYYIKSVTDKGIYVYNYNVFIPHEQMIHAEKSLTNKEKLSAHEVHTLINEVESRHIEWAIDSSLENKDKEWFDQIMEKRVFYEE